MNEETASGHAVRKRARTTHVHRPLSLASDNESRPVGLDLKQKKPASAPDPVVLKRISATQEQPDNFSDDAVS